MDFVDLLVNGSPMAAFAIFLIYLYKQQMFRMDALVDKFQNQLEGMRKEYKSDVEEMRNRYDQVISTYNSEAKETRSSLADKLNGVGQTLRKVSTDLSNLWISHETNRDEIRDLTVKVEQGIKLVETMQEEARLKAIARSAAHSRDQRQ